MIYNIKTAAFTKVKAVVFTVGGLFFLRSHQPRNGERGSEKGEKLRRLRWFSSFSVLKTAYLTLKPPLRK
jgi:hypothetical protein